MIVTEAELKLVLGLSASITDEEAGVLSTVHREAEKAVKKFIGYDPVYKELTEFYPMGYMGVVDGDEGTWEVNADRSIATWAPGGAGLNLMLRRLPVRSITSLKTDTDGRFGQREGSFADDAWTLGQDYYLELEMAAQEGMAAVCRSGILHAARSLPITPGSIKVTYYAGLTPKELAGNGVCDLVDGTGIVSAVKKTAVKAMSTYFAFKKKGRPGFTAGALTGENMGDYSYSIDTGALEKAVGMITQIPVEAQIDCEEWRHLGLQAL